MKLQKIILAAAAAAVLALSASCRATGEDGGGGGDGGPATLEIFFHPNGGYWLNSDDPDDKSDTEAKSTTQIVGRLITPPALSETESETPLPFYFDWEGQQRRSNLYQFVGWYQLPEEADPPAVLGIGEEVPQDLIARVVSTDNIVDVDALLPGYNTVTGELSQVTLYALWREPPECYRVSFYKFFDGTAQPPQQEEISIVELQEGNSGVSQTQRPSSVSRTHYNSVSGNWYKVLDDGTVSDTAFDLNAEITDSHILVMKWTGITYNLSFKPNGGTPAPSVVQIQYPTLVAASDIPTATRNYYTLGGWYKTGAQITDANKLRAGYPVTANTEYTANWTPQATYYLESLIVNYDGQTTNAITPAFDTDTPNYYATSTMVTGNVTIKAKAIDPNAKITIILKGTTNTILKAETASGSSGVIGTTSVPNLSLTNKTIQVSVKSTLNTTQVYEIDLTLDQGSKDVWSGTVNNKLNGGTSSDGKEITQLIAWNADRSLKAVATLGTGSGSRTWTMEKHSYEAFRPQTFIVYLSGSGVNSVSDEITPAGAPLGPATGIVINATKAGIRLADANEFLQLGDPANIDKDFALGGDIDLAGTGTDWTGPDGYIGHFYGNGYTIRGLVLTQSTGTAGLFGGLGNNAVVENFTLEVSTSDNLKYTTPITNMSFGGVAGYLSNTVTIKNVTINGTIELYGVNSNTGFIIGGFVGSTGTSSIINIDKCVSNINIKVKSSLQGNSNTSGVGGFIGLIHGETNITNSYSTGDIEFTSGVDSFFLAGCFAGGIGSNVPGYENWHVTIRNSYASGNLVIDYKNRTAFNANFSTNVGGLVGGIRKVGTIVVENCAYIGNKIVVLRSSSDGLIGMGRIYGGTNRSAGQIGDTANSTFTNNIARLGITYGATTSASDQGTANNNAGTLTETAQNGIMVGNTFGPGIDGSGVSSTALTQTSTWGTTLGWSQTIWDFSTVGSLGRPVLKK
ncbi:MAG: hypothetical protein Pg6A_10270 [Termitinemataceae bacterium]|nr:MAG: hypothetical protein Pg6A_10270 [Termitinemataceae bacterium]